MIFLHYKIANGKLNLRNVSDIKPLRNHKMGTYILDKYEKKIMEICAWVVRFCYGCDEASASEYVSEYPVKVPRQERKQIF